jgi:NAD-dependent deacetylase
MSLEMARRQLGAASRVAVLTGAGVSAQSGIPTFRDAQTGYWAQFSPEELATPEAYTKNPERVWAWYAERHAACSSAEPNAAHTALAALEASKGDGFTLVTQNVDGLHARGGSRRVLELHGNLRTARCERCRHVQNLPAPQHFVPPPTCERCGSRMRPNVVWFTEPLPADTLEAAAAAFTEAEVAIVVGTSALVEPAASLARVAKARGAYLIEINPEVTPLSKLCDVRLSADAVKGINALLEPQTIPPAK